MEPNPTGATTASAHAALVDTGRKRDAQGRRIITAGERAALLAAYADSGLTQRAFARQEGLNYSTFTAWLQGRRRAGEAASGPAKVRFARQPEVVMSQMLMFRSRQSRPSADGAQSGCRGQSEGVMS